MKPDNVLSSDHWKLIWKKLHEWEDYHEYSGFRVAGPHKLKIKTLVNAELRRIGQKSGRREKS